MSKYLNNLQYTTNQNNLLKNLKRGSKLNPYRSKIKHKHNCYQFIN